MPGPSFYETFNPQDIVPLAMKKFDIDLARRKLNMEEAQHRFTLGQAKEKAAKEELFKKIIGEAMETKPLDPEDIVLGGENPWGKFAAGEPVGSSNLPSVIPPPEPQITPELYLKARIKSGLAGAEDLKQIIELEKSREKTPRAITEAEILGGITGNEGQREKFISGKQAIQKPTQKEPYKVGQIIEQKNPDGTTSYKIFKGLDEKNNPILEEAPEMGGKGGVKGYDTEEEAFEKAKQIVDKAGKDSGLVPSIELGAGNKWIPKPMPNITVRIPPFSAAPGMPPGWVINRRTGEWEYKEPMAGEGGKPAVQSALDWQSMKKSALTINGPVFKRLIDNAEILAKGVKNPETGEMSKPELDQVADMRDGLDDGLFAQISNKVKAFNAWDQFINYQISDPKMAAFKSKVMANIDVLANVYSGGGTVTSDFKMKFAKDLFEAGLSKEAFRAKMETHKHSVIDRARKYAEPNVAGLSTTLDIPAKLPGETTKSPTITPSGGIKVDPSKIKKGW